MGRPMAMNLLRAGYRLIGYNRTPAKAAVLVNEGGEAAEGPTEVANRSDVVITMLLDSPDVELVYLGADGVLAGARPGSC